MLLAIAIIINQSSVPHALNILRRTKILRDTEMAVTTRKATLTAKSSGPRLGMAIVVRLVDPVLGTYTEEGNIQGKKTEPKSWLAGQRVPFTRPHSFAGPLPRWSVA